MGVAWVGGGGSQGMALLTHTPWRSTGRRVWVSGALIGHCRPSPGGGGGAELFSRMAHHCEDKGARVKGYLGEKWVF